MKNRFIQIVMPLWIITWLSLSFFAALFLCIPGAIIYIITGVDLADKWLHLTARLFDF